VSEAGDILLLGEPALGRQLAGRCDEAGVRVVCRSDPYDALDEMSHRSWPVVVLTGARPEFAALCRASRRLQAAARLLALCHPAQEPDVRKLAPKVLDDYFICPPTRGDWQSMIRAASGAEAAALGRPLAGPLTAGEIGSLVESVESMQSLEARVAALVGEHLGCKARWVDADSVPGGVRPLLLGVHDVPRALLTEGLEGGVTDPSGAAFISAIQDCLPSLAAAARRCESLNQLAVTDHLTGAYNRRYFYLATDRILKRAGGEGFRVTLLLYDIDDFKRYNDAYGHAAGDEILRETALLMKKITRSQDIVARIGGDEFAVLFWDSQPLRSPDSKPLKTAYDLADRFRQAVGKLRFHSLGPEAKGALTISGGLASFPGAGSSVRELLRSADRALRKAKQAGKDAIKLVGAD